MKSVVVKFSIYYRKTHKEIFKNYVKIKFEISNFEVLRNPQHLEFDLQIWKYKLTFSPDENISLKIFSENLRKSSTFWINFTSIYILTKNEYLFSLSKTNNFKINYFENEGQLRVSIKAIESWSDFYNAYTRKEIWGSCCCFTMALTRLQCYS